MVVFEAGVHCVAMAGLELMMQTRLTANSQRFTCPCLQSVGCVLPRLVDSTYFQETNNLNR